VLKLDELVMIRNFFYMDFSHIKILRTLKIPFVLFITIIYAYFLLLLMLENKLQWWVGLRLVIKEALTTTPKY